MGHSILGRPHVQMAEPWNLSVTVCVSMIDIPPARLTANYSAPIAVLMSTPVYAHPAL